MDADLKPDFITSLQTRFLQDDERVAEKQAEARNVEVVRKQYLAIANGDYAAFGELLTHDVDFEIVGPAEVPIVGGYRGRERVTQKVRENFDLLDTQNPEVQAVVAQGETVVVHGRESGRVKKTGRTYDIHWVQIFTFRDGKVARFREVFDSAPIVEAMRG